MGRSTAEGYNEAVNEGILSLEQAVGVHLKYNHYPPVPDCMVPIAIRAISKARQGLWDKKVKLPKGVYHKEFGKLVPVSEVIRSYHLDTFLDQEDPEDF